MKPFVRVVGVSVLAGCHVSATPSETPPPPPPAEEGPGAPMPTANPPAPPPEPIAELGGGSKNPPAPLPTWDSVLSTHPPGATNPPYPVLVVARDSGACFKAWAGGMMPPPPRQRAAGGHVEETHAAAREAFHGSTEVQCPEGQPATLLAAWDAAAPKP